MTEKMINTLNKLIEQAKKYENNATSNKEKIFYQGQQIGLLKAYALIKTNQ